MQKICNNGYELMKKWNCESIEVLLSKYTKAENIIKEKESFDIIGTQDNFYIDKQKLMLVEITLKKGDEVYVCYGNRLVYTEKLPLKNFDKIQEQDLLKIFKKLHYMEYSQEIKIDDVTGLKTASTMFNDNVFLNDFYDKFEQLEALVFLNSQVGNKDISEDVFTDIADCIKVNKKRNKFNSYIDHKTFSCLTNMDNYRSDI